MKNQFTLKKQRHREDVNFYVQEYGTTEEDALKALKKQREYGF